VEVGIEKKWEVGMRKWERKKVRRWEGETGSGNDLKQRAEGMV
jgi:hypothetical protein